MSKAWKVCAVAAIGLSGCVAMSDEEEEELKLRVTLEGYSIETVEVVQRGALGELDDDMRPQPSGLTGVIFTDTTSGETLAEGWTGMPTPMPSSAVPQGVVSEGEVMPAAELYVVVPMPDGDAILTLSVPTEAGPIVMTTSFDADALWQR